MRRGTDDTLAVLTRANSWLAGQAAANRELLEQVNGGNGPVYRAGGGWIWDADKAVANAFDGTVGRITGKRDPDYVYGVLGHRHAREQSLRPAAGPAMEYRLEGGRAVYRPVKPTPPTPAPTPRTPPGGHTPVYTREYSDLRYMPRRPVNPARSYTDPRLSQSTPVRPDRPRDSEKPWLVAEGHGIPMVAPGRPDPNPVDARAVDC